MAFNPLGDVVEINSSLPVEELKAAIRAKKKRWYDPNRGARGWIVGSTVCLWSDLPLGGNVPTVLGKIEAEGSGARVRLRSASSFSGILLPLGGLVGLGLGWMRFGPLDWVDSTWILSLFCVLVLLGFWLARSNRGDADELVKFLRKVAAPKAKLERTLLLKPPPK